MKKRIVCLLVTLFLLGSAALPASAETYTGGSGWKVSYDGSRLNSNFTSAELTDSIQAIQPGDEITFTVALENASGEGSSWYMLNEVLQSLEDSQAAADGGAYAYRLVYRGGSGEESVLYDSDTVGGEKDSAAGNGLHEATDSLKEYFFLDALDSGRSAEVQLTVALDGETQGNGYQNTLAELQMSFAVEKADGSTGTKTPGTTGVVQTGDSANLPLWLCLMALSGGMIVFLLLFRRKGEKRHD